MIELFNKNNSRLTDLADLIKLMRIDSNYISLIREYENGKS
jgi:hypothetical protein